MSEKIAIVIESLGGGGAQHVAATLANAWAGNRIDVTVITFQAPETDVFKLHAPISRVVIAGSKPSGNLAAALIGNLRRIGRLRAALKACRAPTVLAFIGSTNILTLLASTGLNRRVIISERNDPVRQSLGRPWNLLRKLVYRHAYLVVANSKSAITTMSAYVPAEHLCWLPNPLRVAPAGSAESVAVASPYFLAVGRLDRQKGHDILLEAFAMLKTDLPDWRMVVLGDGPLRDNLQGMAANLSISDRVYFAGFAENPFPWYRAAQIFIHPARFEGLPNAVLEAMNERLPVVVTDAQEGLRDFVVDRVSGLVVPVGSADALAAAMVELAKDPNLRQHLGAAAHSAVELCRADNAVTAWTAKLELAASVCSSD